MAENPDSPPKAAEEPVIEEVATEEPVVEDAAAEPFMAEAAEPVVDEGAGIRLKSEVRFRTPRRGH